MKEVILEFLRNMKDEEYAKNIAYVIAVTACSNCLHAESALKETALWKHGVFLFARKMHLLIWNKLN